MNVLTHMRRKLRLFIRNERGSQIIELAFALPFLLLMFAATAELGRLFYTYNTLAKATKVGARYISTMKNVSLAESDARNLVRCGTTAACSDSALIVSGLEDANIQITPPAAGAGSTKYVTVAIQNYTYQPLVFDLGEMVYGNNISIEIPLAPSTTMRYMVAP